MPPYGPSIPIFETFLTNYETQGPMYVSGYGMLLHSYGPEDPTFSFLLLPISSI
jgi:hypothetical protein